MALMLYPQCISHEYICFHVQGSMCTLDLIILLLLMFMPSLPLFICRKTITFLIYKQPDFTYLVLRFFDKFL